MPEDGTTIVFEVDINVSTDKIRKDADGEGEFVVTISGRPEETEELAHFTVHRLSEQISFPHGHVQVHGGFIEATRIPESAEEEAEVGDKPHLMKLSFTEAPRFMPSFDPAQLTRSTTDPQAFELLKQFNTAKAVRSEVERFVALFKVLEKAYASGSEKNLLLGLKRNSAFIQLVSDVVIRHGPTEEPLDPPELNRFLRKLVRVRDNCAHLRRKTGYAPGDPRIATEVRPLLEIVETLATECVRRFVYPGGPPEPQSPF
jgi:hypothetical protein